MSLPDDAEDEYLDDLIQLIPSDVVSRADIEGYSYYKQKSYVPVSFFNNERNIKLLSDCRPLRIELVDLNTVNKADDDDDAEDESDDIKPEAISVEAKQLLGKLSSNGLTIKHKNNIGKVESEKKDNAIDFKKNTGLIGLKVRQTLEVLEIDSESEESNNSNENADKCNDKLNNVNKNNDNIKVDTIISVDVDSVIADISKEMTKLFECDTNCNSGTASVKENTSACDDSNNGLTSDAPKVTDEISKSLIISNSEDSQKQIKLKVSSTKTSEKNEVVHISREINYVQQNKSMENTYKKKEVIDNYSITSELKQESKQNIRSGANTMESAHKISHAVIAENISEIQGNNQGDNINGVASPVFSCTPQIKNKKSSNKTDDVTCLVFNQPKDLNDNRFEPNAMKNITNNSLKLSESVIDIEKTIDECILENLNTQVQSTKQIPKNLIENSGNKAQTVNDIKIPTQSNKICGTAVNTPRFNKICSKNTPGIEYLNAPCTTAVYQSQTSNNEKIIRIKLNEQIDTNTIEKDKSLKKLKVNRKAAVNVDTIASKLHSHAAGCANRNDPKAFQKSGIIFDQNKQIFQQYCSAIVQDLDNITPDSSVKRPQILERDPNIVLKTKTSPKKSNLVKINPYRWCSDSNQNKFSITSSVINISPTKSTENKNTNLTNANAMANGVNPNNVTKSPIRDETIIGSNLKRHLVSISENYQSKPVQNYLIGHQTNLSFGPKRSKYVPPMLRNKRRQVLGIGRYTQDGYLNYINNPNTVPVAPYPGYSNHYNSYWPYLYTRLPPPPPPPPPPPVTVASANNSAIVEPPVNKRVNVIKQINIKVRPAEELLKNNTDVKTKSDDNVTSINNTSPQNNSPTVVTSKSQMFEELEKEMMNIQEGALHCIINKDSRDYRMTPHNNKEKRLDPRCQPGSNVANNIVPANEKSDSKKESSECKVKQKSKAFKRPSDLTISKDSVKKKKNVMSKVGKDKGPGDATGNSSQRYSAPILPIPSYTESLKILTQATNNMQEHVEKPCKKIDVDNSKTTHDKDKVKKISLDEYKNREGKKQLSEKKKQKCERKKERKSKKRESETKNSDQDQGYDSDTTVIL